MTLNVEKLGYSIEEAAGAAGIGRSLLCELIRRGDIDSVKIGRRRIIPADSLRRYIARLVEEQRAVRATPDVDAAGPP